MSAAPPAAAPRAARTSDRSIADAADRPLAASLSGDSMEATARYQSHWSPFAACRSGPDPLAERRTSRPCTNVRCGSDRMKIDIIVVYIQRYERGHEVCRRSTAFTWPRSPRRGTACEWSTNRSSHPIRYGRGSDRAVVSAVCARSLPPRCRDSGAGKIVVAGGPHHFARRGPAPL